MRWLRSVAREVLELFVDDGSFAIAILVWLALVWWCCRASPPVRGGPGLRSSRG